MYSQAIWLGALAFAEVSLGQFVPAPKDLTEKRGGAGINVRYKQVPEGICELDKSVKSYSGYADIAEHEHSFFWFFEARDVDPEKAPLTVWINGGPGSSSMIGLFQELGPCYISPEGKPVNNPHAWNKLSNVIFIDQPTMTGFSYSNPVKAYEGPNGITPLKKGVNVCPDKFADTCGTWSAPEENNTANSTATAVPRFWKTLQGFMGAFPQYSKNGLNFATESYGGHYAPAFSDYIVQQDKKNIPGAVKINLKNVLIGNGWSEPLIQYPTYYDFGVSENTYVTPFVKNKTLVKTWRKNAYGKGGCRDKILKCRKTRSNKDCKAADNYCYSKVENLFDIGTKRDEYDIRELTPDPFPPSWFEKYLNTPKVQKAIGAFQNYSSSSDTVGATFGATGDDVRNANSANHIRSLLANDVQVVLYVGDADYICNWYGVELYSKSIKHAGYDKAGFAKMQTPDKVYHADIKQSGLFSFVRVFESGHEVPFYQPLAALSLFERAIHRKDLATGKLSAGKDYLTKGPQKSTYRQGDSTVQYKKVPKSATYNTTTNEPNPPSGNTRQEDDDMEQVETFAPSHGLARFRFKHLGRD